MWIELAHGRPGRQPVGFAKKDDPLATEINDSFVAVAAEGRPRRLRAQLAATHFPNAYPRWYVDGFGEPVLDDRGEGRRADQLWPRASRASARVLDRVSAWLIRDVLVGQYLGGTQRKPLDTVPRLGAGAHAALRRNAPAATARLSCCGRRAARIPHRRPPHLATSISSNATSPHGTIGRCPMSR